MGKYADNIKNVLLEKLSKDNINKVNAAFGTMLIKLLALVSPVIIYFVMSLNNVLLATFIVGAWEVFAVFLGVLIMTFFGAPAQEALKLKEKAIDTIDDVADEIKEVIDDILPDEPEAEPAPE